MFWEASWAKVLLERRNTTRMMVSVLIISKHLIVRKISIFLLSHKSQLSLHMLAKVPRAIARRHLATTKNINLIRWIAPAIIGAKPKLVRGKKCDRVNDGYVIIGEHPD